MRKKFIDEIRRAVGMIKDVLKDDMPKNKYINAENINLTPNHGNTAGGATAMLGSTFAVSLGSINIENDNDDYKAWRVPVDLTSAGISHDFTITTNGVDLVFNVTTSGATPADRLANFITALEAATVGILGDVYISNTATTGINYIGFRSYGANRTLVETITGVNFEVIIIKEFFGTSANGFFRPLKSIYINKNLYILSTSADSTVGAFRIGVAQKNYSTGNWTYTVLLETNQITYSQDALIDLDGEIDFGDRVSLYWTGEGYLPRVFYIIEQDTWVANSGVQYYDSLTENADAYYNYNTLLSETSLQILENFGRVSGTTVNNGGGQLKSGNWQYFIRQKTNEAFSGTGPGSGFVSIFSLSLGNTRLYGSVDGSVTTKSVSVDVEGLNPLIYDKFELISVNNTAGIFTAVIAGEYDITGESMTVIHTGFNDVAEFSLSELATQQVVVLDAKNLVIARNRLFLSNITTQNDLDLSEYFKNQSLETIIDTVSAIGTEYSTVGEYQNTQSIYLKTGYMWNETYRFGAIVYYKNGTVSSPYFIADYKIGSTGITTFELADVAGGLVYVYGIGLDIDLSGFPDIDGVSFADAVEAISIVRCDCIPEVMATGYFMPQSDSNVPMPVDYDGGVSDRFTVGNMIWSDQDGVTVGNRQRLAFLSPDILFGTVSISEVPEEWEVYNYGQPSAYNRVFEFEVIAGSPAKTIRYGLIEFDGDITTPATLTPTGESAFVPFNTLSPVQINGMKLSTLVNEGYHSGINQQMVALGTTTSILKRTANPDVWFYFGQLFSPKTNKYGNENIGLYKSTGNYTKVTGSIIPTEVWGGDTFTEKTFIKALNQSSFAGAIGYNDLGAMTVPANSYCYIVANLSDGQIIGTEQIELPAATGVGIFFSWTDIRDYTANVAGTTTVVSYQIVIFTGTFRETGPISVTTPYLSVTDYSPFSPGIGIAATFMEQRIGVSFYSQNRGNYQLRTFNPANITDDNLNYPYTTTEIQDWLESPLSEGELNYSLSYSPLQDARSGKTAYDPELPVESKETNRMVYSELKLENGLLDNYRVFKPLNSKYYPAKYGGITNTFLKDMNYLVVFMDEIVLFQSLDQQAMQQNTDGVALTIGDGTVLGAREQPISNIGSPFKTFALGYKDYRGVNHMSWFNPFLKKWMRWTGAIDDLGDETANQSFLTENTDFCFEEGAIRLGHDFMNDELFLTASTDIAGSSEWNNGNAYNEGETVYVFTNSILEQRRYFKARIAVPEDKNPTLPINQVNYWEPLRQSNFTLSFNEKAKVMSDFKWFTPLMYLNFNETFLSHAINTDTEESSLFEHNVGLELYDTTDIDSSVTIVFNDVSEFFKKYRTFRADINIKPYFMILRTEDFVTYATSDDFIFDRPQWAANVKNDATISGDNPTGSNDENTAQPSDHLCELTLFFRNDTDDDGVKRATVKDVIMRFLPLPKFFSS